MPTRSADMLLRFRSSIIHDTRQVFEGIWEQPQGQTRGVVKLGRCDQSIVAQGGGHLKGSSVIAVGVNGGNGLNGSYAVLPGPPAKPGPVAEGSLKVSGQPFSAPPDEILTLRFLVSTGAASSAVHPGTLNITQATWSMNTGITLDSIAWTGLVPLGGDVRKYWILPDGGSGVGSNSVAAAVERDTTSTLLGADGRSSIQVYNTTTSTVTESLSDAAGRRFKQPVPDDDLWWYVEYFNGASGTAELRTLPLDLSSGHTVVHSTTAFDFPTAQLHEFFLTPTQGISALFNGTTTAPVTAWFFNRSGIAFPFPADVPFTSAAAIWTFANFHQSGRPDPTLNSWKPKFGATSSALSHLSSVGGSPIVETGISLSEVLQFELPSVDMPGDPTKVITKSGPQAAATIRIVEKATGNVGTMFVNNFQAGDPRIEAVWVEG